MTPVGSAADGGKPRRFQKRRLAKYVRVTYRFVSLPVAVVFLFYNRRIHPAYKMTWVKRLQLALRMHRTTRGVFTGTSYRAHLAMAVKLLEIPPKVKGDVVECGCFLGGSTANLSLVCDIVGRTLVVYDSFEGLPAPHPNDRFANAKAEGLLKADLDQVRANVRKFGAIERCTFRKGWFNDTLPDHDSPIVLCFLDVDFQASLRECVLNLWPHLTERGYVFIDEYVYPDYCALFYSEKFWRKYFDTTPPGLLGAGSGVPIGEYYLGPLNTSALLDTPGSIAYTRKDFSGYWDFYPDETETLGAG